MALQARAEATRRRILESAVDLFNDLGYGETGLADVLQRAGVSKGAFYYHFDSKEAVAGAIIEEYRARVSEAIAARTDASAPLLDRIIFASFVTAEILRTDKTAKIGNQLVQALSQISTVGARVLAAWIPQFVDPLTKALTPWESREGQAAEVAEAMWAGLLGSYLLSDALDGDPHSRLASSWRTALRAIAPQDAITRYDAVIDLNVQTFRTVSYPA